MSMTKLEKWMAYFVETDPEKLREIAEGEPAIQKALQLEDEFCKDEEQVKKYKEREAELNNYYASTEVSREEDKGNDSGNKDGEEILQKMTNRGLSITIIVTPVDKPKEDVK